MKRIEYIDLAKGICILLVVLDHISISGYFCKGDYPMNDIFNQIRMPLYFILSGLFFKDYNGGTWEFLLRKTNRILIPYLFFITLFRTATWLAKASTGNDFSDIWGSLWFLRCLFFMNIIFVVTYYSVRRVTSNAVAQDILLGSCMLGIGIVGYHIGNLHLNFGTALTCMPYLWFGYVLNRRLNFLRMRMQWWWAVGLSVAFFVVLHYTYVGDNLFYNNSYCSSLPALYLSGLMGTLAILMLSSIIGRLPVISYIGRYSIIVLCTHMLVIKIAVAFLKLLPFGWHGTSLVPSLIVLALTIAMCMFLCWLLSKYLPWFTAQKDLIPVTGNSTRAS